MRVVPDPIYGKPSGVDEVHTMCRWLAYRGEPLRPSELVLHPQHSLVAQSLDSPLGAETVNGDGFGFGWHPKDQCKTRSEAP